MSPQPRANSLAVPLLIAVLACGALACAWQAVQAHGIAAAERQAKEQEAARRAEAELQASAAEERSREAELILVYFQSYVFGTNASPETITLREALDRAEPAIASTFSGQPLTEAAVRSALSVTYQHLSRFDSAIHQLQWALELRRQALGPRHPATLGMMNNLGVAYQRAGMHERALALLEETLRLKQENLGANHRDTIIGANNLALSYRQIGQAAEAVEILKPILEQTRSRQDLDTADTLTCLNTLALAYLDLHQIDKANGLHKEMLRFAAAAYGKSHPTMLHIMESLVSACIAGDEPTRAAALLTEAIQLCRALAAEFPDNSDYKNRLAALLKLQAQHFGPAATETTP